MEVGRYTYGQQNISILWGKTGGKLQIGSFCSIAKHCRIYLDGTHRMDWISTYPFGYFKETRKVFPNFSRKNVVKEPQDVTIGHDVWIADCVTIMYGVNIGSGSVIANNSHVVTDVPPYAIVGGNPAKIIKYRFSEGQIEKLLQIQWWNWEESKINNNCELMCDENRIDEFIDLHFNKINEKETENKSSGES